MKDSFDDKHFSGTDWDGDGIDWFDYEFDREVYRETLNANHKRRYQNNDNHNRAGRSAAVIAIVLMFLFVFIVPTLAPLAIVGILAAFVIFLVQ